MFNMNFLPVLMSHGISHITGMVLSLQKNGNTASIQAYTLLMLFEPLSRVRRLMQLFLSYGYWQTISTQCHSSLPSFRRGWGEETDDISDYSSAVFCVRFTSYKIKTRLIITSGKMIRFLSM